MGISRRRMLGWLAGTLAWPLGASAQQQKVHAIGILTLGNPDPAAFVAVLREELAKLGYVAGRNVRFELRSAAGNAAGLPALAAELVGLPVDVLVTWQTPPTMAARGATEEIPIVMVGVGDPVATSIVSNLAKPGGNITGNTAIAAEVMSKNVELLREIIPAVRRVAVYANTVDPFTQPFLQHIETSASSLGIEIVREMALPTDKAEPHFEVMRDKKVDAVIIQPTLIKSGVAELALQHQLPSISMVGQYASAGGLLSYGANAPAQWREGAIYVDKVLKGQATAELPVAQPTRFDLIINIKTAKALGLTISPALLVRADEVIE